MRQVAGAFILLLGVMLLVAWSTNSGSLENLGLQRAPREKTEQGELKEEVRVKIGEAEFRAQVADTPAEREIGLSRHKSLEEDEGMLFVFEKENVRPSFWMKGMAFALDIIWIDDGQVVQITVNTPVPEAETPEAQIPLYLPNEPVDYVLELNAGATEKNNIKVGDKVEIQFENVNSSK